MTFPKAIKFQTDKKREAVNKLKHHSTNTRKGEEKKRREEIKIKIKIKVILKNNNTQRKALRDRGRRGKVLSKETRWKV